AAMTRLACFVFVTALTLGVSQCQSEDSCTNGTAGNRLRFEPVQSPRFCLSDNRSYFNIESVGHCVMLCSRRVDCKSFSFSDRHRLCLLSNYTDCVLKNGSTLYRKIIPGRTLCQVSIDGRNYVLAQRRASGSLSFARNWTAYETGFGNCSSDYWIGLSALHSLTYSHGKNLRIEISETVKQVLIYSHFSISSPTKRYALNYTAMLLNNGSTVDLLASVKGFPFSTYDRDSSNDACSSSQLGNVGWWIGNDFWNSVLDV
ncbi:hypothetical protein BOX15_Mlig017018g1, partial [Macrostomum lignano]